MLEPHMKLFHSPWLQPQDASSSTFGTRRSHQRRYRSSRRAGSGMQPDLHCTLPDVSAAGPDGKETVAATDR